MEDSPPDRAGARPSYGGCQGWIGVFSDYLIDFMSWVTGHQINIKQTLIE